MHKHTDHTTVTYVHDTHPNVVEEEVRAPLSEQQHHLGEILLLDLLLTERDALQEEAPQMQPLHA